MLSYIVKFFKTLNSNRNPSEIANAFCVGIVLGFMPQDNLLWYLVFIFFLFVRINKPLYLIIAALASQFAYLLDPLFDYVGYNLLTYEKFSTFFATILEIPFVGFTKFNNTIVAGSLCVSLAIYIPLFILVRLFVLLWRKKLSLKLADSAAVKAFSKLPIINKLIELAEKV